jgi:hypothetical protein
MRLLLAFDLPVPLVYSGFALLSRLPCLPSLCSVEPLPALAQPCALYLLSVLPYNRPSFHPTSAWRLVSLSLLVLTLLNWRLYTLYSRSPYTLLAL